MSSYQPGELLDVVIKGARVMAAGDPADDRTLRLGSTRITLLGSTISSERIAPAEWPPAAGDVWADRDGDRWFASASANGSVMTSASGLKRNDSMFLHDFGPVVLTDRPGWTRPDPWASEPDPWSLAVPVNAVARVEEVAAGLECMAALIRANPHLVGEYVYPSLSWNIALGDLVDIASDPAWSQTDRDVEYKGQTSTHFTITRDFGPLSVSLTHVAIAPAKAAAAEVGERMDVSP